MMNMENSIINNTGTLTLKEVANVYISIEEDINKCDAILSTHNKYDDPTKVHSIRDSEMAIILEVLSRYKAMLNNMMTTRCKIVTQ